MLKKFKSLSPEFKKYLAVGISVYFFEILVILLAKNFGTGDVLAVSLGFWIGLGLSFLLQKIVSFGDKRMHHKVLISQAVAFSLLVLFNYCFIVVFTKIAASLVPLVVSRTLSLGVTTIWNFYIYKTRIFKKEIKEIY